MRRSKQISDTAADRLGKSKWMLVPKVMPPRSVQAHGTKRKVPKIIHQTMKSTRLPMHMWTSGPLTWIRQNPSYEYRFYDDAACERVICRSDHPDIMKAWRACKIGAMKADLFRYAVLVQDGGVYADIDTVCKAPIGCWLGADIDYATDLRHAKRLSPMHQVIAISPGHPLMRACIDLSIQNILNDDPLEGRWGTLAGYAGPPVLDLVYRQWIRPKTTRMTPQVFDWLIPQGTHRRDGRVTNIYGNSELDSKLSVKYYGYKQDLEVLGRSIWRKEWDRDMGEGETRMGDVNQSA